MDILFLSPADWSGPWGRFQHLAAGLADHNRVLYLDGLGVRTIGVRDARRAVGKVMRFLAPAPNRIGPGRSLFRATPLAIPGQRSPLVRRLNRSLLGASIGLRLRQCGMRRPLVWISYPHPDLVGLLDRLERTALVYDCVDRWDEFRRGYLNLGESEASLLGRADLVFVTATPLLERIGRLHPRVHLVPNAVDVEGYRRALADGPRLPADVERIPSPRIGFVGNIAEWVDLDLIEELAERRPHWHFVLVGPWQADRPPGARPNIHWLGPRHHEAVPLYLAAFDACLVPFVENELTESVDPLKLYEYLAAGRPVVSTPLPQAAAFEGVVRFTRGVEGFLDALEESLSEPPESERARVEAVRPHSWSRRMEQILEHLRCDLGLELGGDPDAGREEGS